MKVKMSEEKAQTALLCYMLGWAEGLIRQFKDCDTEIMENADEWLKEVRKIRYPVITISRQSSHPGDSTWGATTS